jgi:hypothetical protein
MITVKGRVVTFTGKDEKQLKELATSLGKTPQETLELVIRDQIKREEAAKKAIFEYDPTTVSEVTVKPTKKTKRSK